MPCIVGVDFDNTVVSYDELMYRIALDRGFVTGDVEKDKTKIRDSIRALPDGELKWRRVQAIAYGEAMEQAKLIDGVKAFFIACAHNGITTYIISHKGEYAAADEKNINLRDAALNWMDQNRFFETDGLGLSRGNVFFESTRLEKVVRIARLGCSYFIDDLEETFAHEAFPKEVKKILFDPHHKERGLNNIEVCSRWSEISERIVHK